MPDVQDEPLAKGLKQARKKPRNFAMLCKGTDVVKLLVDKKPIKAGEVQAAKTESKATLVVTGVVQGDGSDLIFKVAGNEEPTVKIPGLREFINDQTGLKLKPRFQMVTELKEIDESDDEGGETEGEETPPQATAPPPPQPPQSSTPISPPPAPPPPPPPPPPVDFLATLVAKMKSLAPHVQAAIQKDAGSRDTLLALVAEFNAKVKAQDADAAREALTALGQALKQGGGSSGPQTTGNAAVKDDFWPAWDQAKSAWQDANDEVNGQLEKLRVELRGVDDKDLHDIAEFGLNAMTKDQRVPLMAAIMDVDKAKGGDPQAAIDKFAKAKDLVVEFRDHLDTDERVEACDDNPFDVRVTIRASLDPALAQLEQTLEKGLAS